MPYSKMLNAAIIAGCLFAAAALVAGGLAENYPALDIVHNGLVLLAGGLVVLFVLSLALRSRMLIVTTGALLAVTLATLIPNLSRTAARAPENAERFLRVATFNMWGKGDVHIKKVEDFLAETSPDVVVLEEIRWKHEVFLRQMREAYPHQTGKHGLVILSKYPVVDKSRLDRPGQPYWQSLLVAWARIHVNGREVDIVGAHMSRPFYPSQQKNDFENLTKFIGSLPGPVIVAGDFNAAPWTHKAQRFSAATDLGRFNTFSPTWPARWRALPLVPVLPIDNVFVSPQLAKVDLMVGRRLESDHLPVIADIALVD
jgi:endonuclease/exonuclease/phosphatase (EEP) superfamily protein YafD